MIHAMPQPLRRWFLLQTLLLLLALAAWPVWAARDRDGDDDHERDPPTRVARVAELEGRVLWFDPESRDWQALARNQTLAEGDRIRVGEGARVGLRIGAHGLWLDEGSELELRRLDEDRIDLDLERGALALRWLSRETAEEAVLRTGDGRFRFERAGAYRIDQRQRASRAQVFEGRLRFEHRGQDDAPLFVDAGEQAELWWEGGPRAERSRLQRGDDGFGDWLVASLGFGRQDVASLRDRPSYRYLSPELTGADELDQHGRWEVSSEYGPLWQPLRVSVDWAPYRQGRWAWTRHWGWTWIDELPWGYATSHYGRWVHWRGRWCWTPGSVIVPRPVFAPGLVAWVGQGGLQIGVQIGGRHAPPTAWVPLAPHEHYRPWYRHSPRYRQRVDPDPITVRRPSGDGGSLHLRVPGAVSTWEPGRDAGPRRPVPLRDEATLRQLQPLPVGPLPVRQGRRPVDEAEPRLPRPVHETPRPIWPSVKPGDERPERPDRQDRQDRQDRPERAQGLPLRRAEPPREIEAPRRSEAFEPRVERPVERRPEPARDERWNSRPQAPQAVPMPQAPQAQQMPQMPQMPPQMPQQPQAPRAAEPMRRIELPRAEPPRPPAEAPRRERERERDRDRDDGVPRRAQER